MYIVLKEDTFFKLGKKIDGSRIKSDEMMAGHTTFRVGGPVSCFIEVCDTPELLYCLKVLRENDERFFLLGNGSNLLVHDEGYEGCILKLSGSFSDITIKPAEDPGYYVVSAGAAASLINVSIKSANEALTGLEFASGIPGTVGGAMVMNAGAYGGEMKDVVKTVTLLDINTGDICTRTAEEMGFGYRDSIIRHNDLIVLRADFLLKKGDRDSIWEKIEELKEKRVSKQPLEYPSAGSTFKRPEGYFAGKLIEDSGLKGYSVGGACVSEKHCGFVINKGGATAADIITLIGDVQRIVKEKQGVMLEPEVIIL
ncbi:MAG: UDP-N-acetylmuramate dehydrogenase [Lachnospiraceae bacterium]|nr:UDP-N-acetylmuramate dehydrogenase [Lachnospiraceae bacterium]